MEIKLKIGYEQLIAIINQLPADEVKKLKVEIDKITSNKKTETNDLEDFILNGPVMDEEKYKEFEEQRKHFNQWRTK